MLAHQVAHQHGLALITEKLQNQRLEEPAAGSSGATPSGATSSSFCSKLPSVNQESYLISDHPGQPKGLSVKGKNVWALSLEPERFSHGSHQQDTSTGCPMQASTSHPISQHLEKDQSVPSMTPPFLCRHRKLRHYCQICDTCPSTPSAPPKKKHCRSLSVPPDGPSNVAFFPSGKDVTASPTARFSIGTAGYGHPPPSHHHYHHHHHHHQSHHGSKIWKPIAMVPLRCSVASNNNSNSNNVTTNTSSYINNGGMKNNNHNKERITANITSHTTAYNDDDNNNNSSSSSILTSVSGNDETSPNSSRLGSCSSASSFKFKLVPPSSFSSSGSFDSGHFTTSDVQTPPSSPIPQPRPASAASDASHSSSVSWFDFSPMRSRVRALQNRSLSYEDKISGCPGCSSSSPCCSSSSSTTSSMPCVYNNPYNTNFAIGGFAGAGRAGGGACCPYHSGGSGREVVPRCHSQPCVLHHRRLGKKRRRDCDRPTLNFNKMTETAYMHSHRKSDPWSSPSRDAQMGLWPGPGQAHSFSYIPGSSSSSLSQNPFVLNPIASSPLDSSELLMSNHLQLEPASSPPLPSAASRAARQQTGGGSSSSRQYREDGGAHSHCQDSMDGSRMIFAAPSPTTGKGNEEEEEDDDEEEEEEEEDEEEEDTNCSCRDNRREEDSVGLFPMGDLDLEQIETH